MAKISNPKRITKEGFPKDYQDLVDPIGIPVNDFSDEIFNAINGNLTVTDNLNMQYKDISLSVDSSGNPKNKTQFQSTLKSRMKGVIVIKLQNLTNTSTYPTSTPFVSYSENDLLITINNVSGLVADNKYTITLLVLGN